MCIIFQLPAIHFLLPFLAAELNLFSINDNNEVAGIDMRRVGWLVLAHQHRSDVAGQPAYHFVARIDHPPVLNHLARLCHVCLHLSLRSVSGGDLNQYLVEGSLSRAESISDLFWQQDAPLLPRQDASLARYLRKPAPTGSSRTFFDSSCHRIKFKAHLESKVHEGPSPLLRPMQITHPL